MRYCFVFMLLALFLLTGCVGGRPSVSMATILQPKELTYGKTHWNQGIRITGSFVALQSYTIQFSPERWQRELQAMRRIGINTIIICPWAKGSERQRAILIEEAERTRMKVFIGFTENNHSGKTFMQLAGEDPQYLPSERKRIVAEAKQLFQKYKNYKCFLGWYCPYEVSWFPNRQYRTIWHDFYRGLTTDLKKISDKPFAYSPSVPAKVDPKRVAEYERNLSAFLRGSGVDILMLQDGVGAHNKHNPYDLLPYVRVTRHVCDQHGIQMWGNVESFRQETWGAAPISGLRKQLKMSACFTPVLVTWEAVYYMSPHADRNPKTAPGIRQLYADYKRSVVDEPYLP